MYTNWIYTKIVFSVQSDYLEYIRHCFLQQFHLGKYMPLNGLVTYQLRHIVENPYRDYLVYKDFGMTQKCRKALMDNLDRLDIPAQVQEPLKSRTF